MGDCSFRAIQVLKSVACIAAEDTRHSQLLLDHYGIKTPMVSYHQYNESRRAEDLLGQLNQGHDIALISDAGTPLISDPGYTLVALVKTQGITVVPIPGPCALITALCASGLPSTSFQFIGFLPAKAQQREKMLLSLAESQETLIFYEAPHRILSTLKACEAILGERECAIAKELTKHFEAIQKGTPATLIAWLEEDVRRQQGEFVVIIAPASVRQGLSLAAKQLLEKLLPHLPLKLAAQIVSDTYTEKKAGLYDYGLSLRTEGNSHG